MADEHKLEYVIRKGGCFYRPNSRGYTGSALEAGRYTLAQAISLTHPNGPDGPRDGLTYCLAREYPEIVKAENAAAELTRLRAENEALREGLAQIKIEALTMGAPGRRTVARGLSHITRICIDAGVTEKLDELEARQLLGETK